MTRQDIVHARRRWIDRTLACVFRAHRACNGTAWTRDVDLTGPCPCPCHSGLQDDPHGT